MILSEDQIDAIKLVDKDKLNEPKTRLVDLLSRHGVTTHVYYFYHKQLETKPKPRVYKEVSFLPIGQANQQLTEYSK